MKSVTLFSLCLAAGFLTVALPSAWSALGHPGAAAATQAAPEAVNPTTEARRAAQDAGKTACEALLAYDRVKECHFVEYVPSIDIRIGEGKLAIGEICDRASGIVAEKVPEIASPWLKLRVFLTSKAPPDATCRRLG